MPGIHVAISSRTVSQRGEIIGTAPELRLTETDQTDPAGRYRLQVTGDVLNIDRAASAAWAAAGGIGSEVEDVPAGFERAFFAPAKPGPIIASE